MTRCSCADKGVSVSCQAAHGCFIPCKELCSLPLAGLEVFSQLCYEQQWCRVPITDRAFLCPLRAGKDPKGIFYNFSRWKSAETRVM